MDKSNLDHLIYLLKQNKLTLFAGAGMSTLAGLPSGQGLGEKIKQNFPAIDPDVTDLMDICEAVIETPPYDKQQLYDFVSKVLGKYEISKYHKALVQYNWNAIFTTNFDNVIETTYNTSPKERAKMCRPVYSSNPTYNLNDPEIINLFKIMGCAQADHPNGEMVLSATDYRLKSRDRRIYLERLFEIAKTGSILYIGYSFKDKIASDIIKEVTNAIGFDKLPYSFMLFRDSIPADKKSERFFNTHKIIPVQCTIEEFFDYLSENIDIEISRLIKPENAIINIRNKQLVVDENIVKLLSNQFTLLTNTLVLSDPGDKSEFLMGKNKSWGVWKEKWDFTRELYDDLYKKTLSLIESEEKSSVLKICGMPGSGKSFLVKRLAFDLYSNVKYPVLIYNNISKLDFTAISTSLEKINDEYTSSFTETSKIPPLKYVFIFDDASINLFEIIRLKTTLSSRGREAVFVLCDRESEWNKAKQLSNYKFENEFTVPEDISDSEFNKLIEYLLKGKYIYAINDLIKENIRKEVNDSFFATIYSYIDPSRRPLDEIIKDQYASLSDLSKQAYEYICCFSQYNFPINIEWLVRLLGCTYNDFETDVLKGDAERIIFEKTDIYNNMLYSTHHRIIAQKTIEFFINDSEELFKRYLNIFNSVNLSNNIENDICEKLLVTFFGDNDRANRGPYSIKQRIELFKAACSENISRTLLHHTGLLECADSNYDEAEKLLFKALETENIGLSRGDSDQNISTSLGVVYSKQAINAIQNKSCEDIVENFVNQAEEFFNAGKHGDFPNVHAYHSHAHHWYIRGCRTTDDEKFYLLGKSIEIINSAKDNLNEDDQQIILELEQQVWSELGIENKIENISQIISEKFNSPNGYYLSGLYYYKKAMDEPDEINKNKMIVNAFRKTKKALGKFPNDPLCLALRCKIYKHHPDFNFNDYFDMLELWYNNSQRNNVKLMYEYGRAAFIIGNYDLSFDVFAVLESGIGVGNILRSRQKDTVTENGKPIKYTGRIVEYFSKKEAFVLPNSFITQRRLKFNPLASNYTIRKGDLIAFEVAFNLRGPIAINVSPM